MNERSADIHNRKPGAWSPSTFDVCAIIHEWLELTT